MKPGTLIANNLAEYRKQQQPRLLRSCNQSQKVPYLTMSEARSDAKRVQKQTGRPSRAYECGCGQFHLTSR